MCGIIGYRGTKQALPIIMDGLHRMEYRGYDSAGIAIAQPEGMFLEKRKGRLDALKNAIGSRAVPGSVGIGHIRWATHGAPTDVNAHPHADAAGRIFVVHNGIIENASDLRRALETDGIHFTSETDTEIFAHLIAKEKRPGVALDTAVRSALQHIHGAYGIAVMATDEPGTIVAARLGSPLILGVVNDDEYVVASDVTAILRLTRKVIYLEDYDIVTLTKDGYRIQSREQDHVERQAQRIDWDLAAAEKGNHPHFMKKEIYEQPASVLTSMQGRVLEEEGLAKLGGLEAVTDRLQEIRRLIIVACGTAYHAGLVGEHMLEEYARIPVEVVHASEFRYKQLIPDPQTAYLAISQSGETADTIAAIKEAKRLGGLTLGIVNVVGSTVARETDAGVYNHIGPEIAVASTKAFTSQMTIMALLTLLLGRRRQLSLAQGQRIVRELARIPAKIEEILKRDVQIREVAYRYAQSNNMLYLGRKYNYPIALEGALKLKEIAYVHAEGYPAGEMKHGPIALIQEDFPSFVIAPQDSVYPKTVSNLEELRARGGPIIAIGTEGDTDLRRLTDDVIEIPKTLEMLTPLLAVVPLQLFAYHVGVARGLDVDKPRNLAKSVTVE